MVVINSEEKNEYLGDLLYRAKFGNLNVLTARKGWFWIGAKREEKSPGSFLWTDRSGLEFENWSEGEPNNLEQQENCVLSGWKSWTQWNDLSCDQLGHSVCEK